MTVMANRCLGLCIPPMSSRKILILASQLCLSGVVVILHIGQREPHVTSVDDQEHWSKSVSYLDNVTAIHADINKYAETILDSGFYDLIIIDGIQRLACARNDQPLNSGGMIVLDNSDWYEALA